MTTICLNEEVDKLEEQLSNHDCKLMTKGFCGCSDMQKKITEYRDEMTQIDIEHLTADVEE